MLTPAIWLKKKLAVRETLVGVMATDHVWPLLVELCANAGIDYLVIDREHGCHTDQEVASVCQVARLANFPILLRTVSCEPAELRRAMDMGPCGLILPCVEETKQLDEVRNTIFMPPTGTRRPGGLGNYWMRDFQYETWRDEFERHFIVIPQIESRRGVESVDVIARHSITTALGLGPYDLSADLGCCWDPDNAEHRSSIERIRDAAEAADKRLWIGCDAVKLREQGYTFLWIGSVSGVLTGSLQANSRAVRDRDTL